MIEVVPDPPVEFCRYQTSSSADERCCSPDWPCPGPPPPVIEVMVLVSKTFSKESVSPSPAVTLAGRVTVSVEPLCESAR